jgi:CubicO group peptidase (beta-lactamase class C family)
MLNPQQAPLTGNTVFGGGNGLFSTADDYLAFCRLFLDNGQAPGGQQLLSPKTIELMGENHVGDLYGSAGSGFGLGFRVITNLADTKALGSVGQLSWSGAFQTFYFIDREENLAAVLMTQTNPYSSFYGSKMPQFVYQAIVE